MDKKQVDIAFMSEGGYLHIVGRSKDMISRGGEKIYANEVENILYKMDEVVSAALIGIPDEKYGEIAVAVIKAKGALTEEDVKTGWADIWQNIRFLRKLSL